MSSHAVLRIYPNGLRARITPQGDAFLLELYDEHGRRKPDLPVITPSLEEAKQMADDHAGVPSRDPWLPVYPHTFKIALPEEWER
jgi:hypothetical protein